MSQLSAAFVDSPPLAAPAAPLPWRRGAVGPGGSVEAVRVGGESRVKRAQMHHVWYIYLQKRWFCRTNVDKYSIHGGTNGQIPLSAVFSWANLGKSWNEMEGFPASLAWLTEDSGIDWMRPGSNKSWPQKSTARNHSWHAHIYLHLLCSWMSLVIFNRFLFATWFHRFTEIVSRDTVSVSLQNSVCVCMCNVWIPAGAMMWLRANDTPLSVLHLKCPWAVCCDSTPQCGINN